MLLAREAVNLNRSPATEGTLLATLLRSPAAIATFPFPIDVRPCCGMSVSPDGGTLAISDNASNVRFVDTKTRRVRKVLPNFGLHPARRLRRRRLRAGRLRRRRRSRDARPRRAHAPPKQPCISTATSSRRPTDGPRTRSSSPRTEAHCSSCTTFSYRTGLGGGIRRPMAPADGGAPSDGSGRREGNQRSRSRRRRQSVAGRRRFTAHGSRCRHAEEGSDSPASSRTCGRDQIGWAGGRGRVGGRIDLVRRSFDRPGHSQPRWAFGLSCPSPVLSRRSHARHDRGRRLGNRLGRKNGEPVERLSGHGGRPLGDRLQRRRRDALHVEPRRRRLRVGSRRDAPVRRPFHDHARGAFVRRGRTTHSAAGGLTRRLRVRRAPRPLARRILLRERAPPTPFVQRRAQRRRQDDLAQGRPDRTRRERDRVVAVARDRRGRKQRPGSALEPARQASPRSTLRGSTRRTACPKRSWRSPSPPTAGSSRRATSTRPPAPFRSSAGSQSGERTPESFCGDR